METVNIHYAKTHLSELAQRMSEGESFLLARSGKPVGRLMPLEDSLPMGKRRMGTLKGQFVIPDNMTALDREVEAMFHNLNT